MNECVYVTKYHIVRHAFNKPHRSIYFCYTFFSFHSLTSFTCKRHATIPYSYLNVQTAAAAAAPTKALHNGNYAIQSAQTHCKWNSAPT